MMTSLDDDDDITGISGMKKQKEGFSAQTAQNFGCCFHVALVYFSPVNFQDSYPKFFSHDSPSLSQEVPGTMLQAPLWLKDTLKQWETLIFLTVIGALTHSLETVQSAAYDI